MGTKEVLSSPQLFGKYLKATAWIFLDHFSGNLTSEVWILSLSASDPQHIEIRDEQIKKLIFMDLYLDGWIGDGSGFPWLSTLPANLNLRRKSIKRVLSSE
jgi:hypothetical protein